MDAPREPLITPAFVLLAVADLAYFTAIGIAIHNLPLYVTGPLGSGEAGAGLAFGAFAFTSLVCRPFAGRIADARGRRPLMIVGAALCAVGMLALPAASSLTFVIALRLLQGVGEAAFLVGSLALLADLAPPSRMGEALSYNSLGLYLGVGLGPPLGETLEEAWGFDAAWNGAAALAVTALAVALLIRAPALGHGPGTRTGLIHRPAVPIGLGFLASLVGAGGFLALAALRGPEVGLEQTSLALMGYGLTVVVCRLAFARVPDRIPPLRLGALSLLVIAMALLGLAVVQTPAGLVLGAIVLAVGITFSTPAFFSAMFATAEPHQRGAAAGTASIFIDLGLGLGPVLLGLVAGLATISWAFAVGSAVAALGAWWTWRLFGVQRRLLLA